MNTQKLEYISFTSYAILLIFNPECSVASYVFPIFQRNPKGFILWTGVTIPNSTKVMVLSRRRDKDGAKC